MPTPLPKITLTKNSKWLQTPYEHILDSCCDLLKIVSLKINTAKNSNDYPPKFSKNPKRSKKTYWQTPAKNPWKTDKKPPRILETLKLPSSNLRDFGNRLLTTEKHKVKKGTLQIISHNIISNNNYFLKFLIFIF